MPPRVSFVVPCYNYSRYLPECLQSILTQNAAVDFEVIVIDDGSTDDTWEIIRGFDDPRIRPIRHRTNQGHAATVNEGLGQARGDFIARIDPDDRYRPGFLTVTLERFAACPQAGLVYGDVCLIDQRGEVTAERSDRQHNGRDFVGNEFLELLERNFICSPTVIARGQVWRAVPPVPDHLAFHDWYFTVMMARAHDFCYVNTVLAEYRVHPMNHHGRIVRDRSEETSLFWLLDRLFKEAEPRPELEQRKQRARRRIYGAQYLTLADKYFGFAMTDDARRCYLRAVGFQPAYLLRADVLRHLAGALIGQGRYERVKAAAKALRRVRSVN